MSLVLVPVRYPLSDHSKRTLETAIDVADEQNADLTVLHVDLYQSSQQVTETELQRAVEGTFGTHSNARYTVRSGFLVEETILDEAAAEDADMVVIGRKQTGRWRRMIGRITGEPNIGSFLRNQLDCRVVIASRE